ncbi:MAG: type II toxin-antitoxin system RelE/ParE family toxin [Luteibaculum sp.]
MAKLVLRQEAINDLSEIWEYTFHKWSENQADNYYESIKIGCSEIADGSSSGKPYDSISKHLLGYKIGKHIIFYTQNENEVEVIRILHEMMNFGSHIKK